KMVGYSLGFVGLMIAIVQGGLIRLILPKLGQRRAIFIGFTINGICMLLFALATEAWMMFVILIPFAFAGIANHSLQGIISNHVPATEQGELQGGLTSMISLTSIIGPLLMNNLFAWFTKEGAPVFFPGAPFVLVALLVGISVV